jgi:hypothetical protein
MITNQNVVDLQQGLNQVKNLSGIRFAYVIAKNLNKVNSEVETFRETIKPSDAYNEYEKERIELCELHANKDEKGKPVIIGNEYDGLAGNKAFDAQMEVLKEKHKEVIDARQKKIDDFNAFLKEESKLELHKIDVNSVPKEITTGQLSGIMPIITGEIKE